MPGPSGHSPTLLAWDLEVQGSSQHRPAAGGDRPAGNNAPEACCRVPRSRSRRKKPWGLQQRHQPQAQPTDLPSLGHSHAYSLGLLPESTCQVGSPYSSLVLVCFGENPKRKRLHCFCLRRMQSLRGRKLCPEFSLTKSTGESASLDALESHTKEEGYPGNSGTHCQRCRCPAA